MKNVKIMFQGINDVRSFVSVAERYEFDIGQVPGKWEIYYGYLQLGPFFGIGTGSTQRRLRRVFSGNKILHSGITNAPASQKSPRRF